jgi:hypothetical protein
MAEPRDRRRAQPHEKLFMTKFSHARAKSHSPRNHGRWRIAGRRWLRHCCRAHYEIEI